MYNPTLDGASHGCWSTSTRNVDVHYSSGVANHFFFDLAEGSGVTAYGTSPLCGPASPVTGIGRDKAGDLVPRPGQLLRLQHQLHRGARLHPLGRRRPVRLLRHRLQGRAGRLDGGERGRRRRLLHGNDFAFTLSAPTTTIDPGTSVTLTANTVLVNGEAEEVTFSAGSTPAGVTVSFEPATVTAGGSTTVTVTAAADAGRSSAPVTIRAAAASITRSAALTVTVNSSPGCTATNGTDVAIPDNTTVQSTIDLPDCPQPRRRPARSRCTSCTPTSVTWWSA